MAKAERARQMLEWCRAGHARMVQGTYSVGGDWMVLWAGVLGLLRGSLYALDRVDAENDPKLRVPQKEWWKALNADKRNPPIFHFFIEDRHVLLHLGEITAGQSFTANVFPGRILRTADGRMKVLPPDPAIPWRPNEVGYAMQRGHYYQGRDPRDLVAEAITWIEQQLGEIERNAA